MINAKRANALYYSKNHENVIISTTPEHVSVDCVRWLKNNLLKLMSLFRIKWNIYMNEWMNESAMI